MIHKIKISLRLTILFDHVIFCVGQLPNNDLTATDGKSLKAVRQNIPVDTTILMCFTLYLCLQENETINLFR